MNETKKNQTIFCRFSGLPLPSYPDFPTLPIPLDAHIIMRTPFPLLIDEINKRKNLTARQNRLLFIALLNQTDLIIFNHPAMPDDRIINLEFSRVLDITTYIISHRFFYNTFPKYVVSKDNANLSNLPHLINTWNDIKDKHTLRPEERKELKEQLAWELLEEKITQAILKKKPMNPTFNKALIKWALGEVGLSEQSKNGIKWAKIFLTKVDKHCRMCNGKKLILNPMIQQLESCPSCNGTGRVSDISRLKFKEVQELRNYMVDNLPETTSYEATRKYVVLKHLSIKLQQISQLHAQFGLEILNTVPQTEEEKAAGKLIIQKEPRKEDFDSHIKYLTALAQFNSAQAIVETDSDEDELKRFSQISDDSEDDDSGSLEEEIVDNEEFEKLMEQKEKELDNELLEELEEIEESEVRGDDNE